MMFNFDNIFWYIVLRYLNNLLLNIIFITLYNIHYDNLISMLLKYSIYIFLFTAVFQAISQKNGKYANDNHK